MQSVSCSRFLGRHDECRVSTSYTVGLRPIRQALCRKPAVSRGWRSVMAGCRGRIMRVGCTPRNEHVERLYEWIHGTAGVAEPPSAGEPGASHGHANQVMCTPRRRTLPPRGARESRYLGLRSTTVAPTGWLHGPSG